MRDAAEPAAESSSWWRRGVAAMSLLWAAVTHPYHEVGEPDWSDEETTYSNPTDKVPPDSMGLPYRDTTRLRSTSHGYQERAMVPVSSLQSSQDYVYASHVRNLATIPAESFHESHDSDPVHVIRTKDGHHLATDGHHRAAASILRGDPHLMVNIEGTEA